MSSIATPHSPKGGPRGHTPPRSPSGEKYLGRTLSPKTSGSLFDINAKESVPLNTSASGLQQNVSTTLTSSFEDSSASPGAKRARNQAGASANEGNPFNKNFAKTDSAALH